MALPRVPAVRGVARRTRSDRSAGAARQGSSFAARLEGVGGSTIQPRPACSRKRKRSVQPTAVVRAAHSEEELFGVEDRTPDMVCMKPRSSRGVKGERGSGKRPGIKPVSLTKSLHALLQGQGASAAWEVAAAPEGAALSVALDGDGVAERAVWAEGGEALEWRLDRIALRGCAESRAMAATAPLFHREDSRGTALSSSASATRSRASATRRSAKVAVKARMPRPIAVRCSSTTRSGCRRRGTGRARRWGRSRRAAPTRRRGRRSGPGTTGSARAGSLEGRSGNRVDAETQPVYSVHPQCRDTGEDVSLEERELVAPLPGAGNDDERATGECDWLGCLRHLGADDPCPDEPNRSQRIEPAHHAHRPQTFITRPIVATNRGPTSSVSSTPRLRPGPLGRRQRSQTRPSSASG